VLGLLLLEVNMQSF